MAGSFGGPFNGLYQGSTGANDAAAALKPLLPNISVYHNGPSTAPGLQAQVTTPAVASVGAGGNLGKFGHFLGGLGTEIGHMATGAATWLGKQAINLAESPVHLAQGISHGWLDNMQLNTINQRDQQISVRMQAAHDNFKSGLITAKQYSLALRSLSQDAANNQKDAKGMVGKVNFDKQTTYKALVDTSAALVTVLTAGFGTETEAALTSAGIEARAATSAGEFLSGKVAAPILKPAVDVINRVAGDPKLFQKLDGALQGALQRSTAEVVAKSTAPMTAGQLARASATNLALKYPIYFNIISSTGNQIYKELDQQKYGDAIRSTAFNALLFLSGGPIGHALKYGGSVVKGVSNRTFGQASFWDELSTYFGKGQADGFVKAITDHANSISDPAARKQFIKNISSVEATNVNAVGGNAAQAALRLANGMKSQYGDTIKLGEIEHATAIQDMVNMAEAMRITQEEASAKGLGQVVVGRLDSRDKAGIAAALKEAPADNRANTWEQLKQQNPSQAWANNANFDRQMKAIINQHSADTGEMVKAIYGIQAQTTVEGFAKSTLEKLASKGYVPIKPSHLEAPFAEGTGRVVTKFNDHADFFTKAVQPIPILGHVGDLLTRAGMSPNAANQTVYEAFSQNLANNLKNAGIKSTVKEVAPKTESTVSGFSKDELKNLQNQGITPETHPDVFNKGQVEGEVPGTVGTNEIPAETKAVDHADTIIKQLSNYAHGLKTPMTDLRMMSTKDIMKATGLGRSDSVAISRAIDRSHLQVNVAVKGLGDHLVDLAHAASPLMGKFMRVEGNLRFTYNPFFQYMRVIPKTEILTESAGGGFFRSIFQGRLTAIGDVRQGLHDGGFLNEPGKLGSTVSSEAADMGGLVDTGANIRKQLLPMQERSIAGLVDAQAQRMGMSWQDYIHTYPQNVRDTIQAIAEYDRKSNFLNSPLARTLNIAIFPFRFDAKVAGFMAQGLARTSPMTQVAVIKGLMDAHAWLNTPAGQVWYSHNAEAIGLFKYITPLATLSNAFQSLLPGHDHSLGNFGELGGLPFGWLPQLLDAEGLTHFNQPGVDAKTGQPIPRYVPATTRGQAATAVQDFLSQLFSYPGATAGLPSKTSITRGAALELTGAHKSTDLKQETSSLSAKQQQYQQNVGGQKPQFQSPIAAQEPGTTNVKPTSTAPDLAAILAAKKAAAQAARDAKKKAAAFAKYGARGRPAKKSDFSPPAAPGQSSVGVL